MKRLAPRQCEILDALTTGKGTTEDVAERLGLTTRTVNIQFSSIFNRTGYHSRVQVAVWWVLVGRAQYR